MKNNKRIIPFILSIGSLFLGMGLMYLLISFVPLKTETIEKTVIKYEVTEEVLTETVERIKDSVVAVQSYDNNRLVGTGTGFVYKTDSSKGYIMTNAHVIEKGDSVSVVFSNGKIIDAELLGSDIYADIAVLSVSLDNILKTAEIGNSEREKIGSTVFAIGTPMGIEYSGTVTRGVLSGKDRLVPVSVYGDEWLVRVIQTDAAINPGNSGGPLFNLVGEVIGINSLKIVIDEVEGMGFAIPIEEATKYVEKLEKGEMITRPYIGIEIIDVNDKYSLIINNIDIDDSIISGLVIVNVIKNTPAEKAGMLKNDIITHINNIEVNSLREFRYELYKNNPNDKINIIISRNGQKVELEAILEDISN